MTSDEKPSESHGDQLLVRLPAATAETLNSAQKNAIARAADEVTLPIRLTPMTATCRVPPLSRVKLGIGWSRGVARDAEQ